MRSICFTPKTRNQCTYWQDQDQGRKTLKRIDILIEVAAREPFNGIDKPEPLLANFSGYWSRRIDDANRLVYRATDDELIALGCRYHYDS
jgi:toxin YoeB